MRVLYLIYTLKHFFLSCSRGLWHHQSEKTRIRNPLMICHRAGGSNDHVHKFVTLLKFQKKPVFT